jgi:hypothetical protein
MQIKAPLAGFIIAVAIAGPFLGITSFVSNIVGFREFNNTTQWLSF